MPVAGYGVPDDAMKRIRITSSTTTEVSQFTDVTDASDRIFHGARKRFSFIAGWTDYDNDG